MRRGHRLGCTTISSERFGESSMNTTAVITFVMLAIERWFWEFDSHST